MKVLALLLLGTLAGCAVTVPADEAPARASSDGSAETVTDSTGPGRDDPAPPGVLVRGDDGVAFVVSNLEVTAEGDTLDEAESTALQVLCNAHERSARSPCPSERVQRSIQVSKVRSGEGKSTTNYTVTLRFEE